MQLHAGFLMRSSKRILSSFSNFPVSANTLLWLQAASPLNYGGLDIRNAVQIAPLACLSSIAGPLEFTSWIPSPSDIHSLPYLEVDTALLVWSQLSYNQAPLSAPSSLFNKDDLSCFC